VRIGNNPLRHSPAGRLAPIAFIVLTHLPNLEGYHEHRLEVVQTCLRSMTQNSGVEFSLCIWDNGSCDVFREWVKDEIRPAVFVESVNLGKTTGRTALTRMMPPKTIICYSDDDMYFYPGWLKPQIEILKHFPNVACVTGYPVRTSFRWGNTNTVAWARANAKVEEGRFIPREWEDDFAVSIGRDVKQHADGSRNDYDLLATYNGKQAYLTSHHCQFIGYSGVIGRVVTWDDVAMGDERPFDITLDTLGLRLATTERYTRHIGNVLHEELRKEIHAIEGVHSTGVCPVKE
jgi:hypothetical protein